MGAKHSPLAIACGTLKRSLYELKLVNGNMNSYAGHAKGHMYSYAGHLGSAVNRQLGYRRVESQIFMIYYVVELQ